MFKLYLFFVLLVPLLLACGVNHPVAQAPLPTQMAQPSMPTVSPTLTPRLKPTISAPSTTAPVVAVPQPTQPAWPTATHVPEVINISLLTHDAFRRTHNLDSFRARVVQTTQYVMSNTPVTRTETFTETWVRKPSGERSEVHIEQFGDIADVWQSGIDAYEVVRVGENVWIKQDGGIIPQGKTRIPDGPSTYIAPDNIPFMGVLNFVHDIHAIHLQSTDETINGFRTTHYVFASEDVQDSSSTHGEQSGEVWVSKPEGFIVRLLIRKVKHDTAANGMSGTDAVTITDAQLLSANQPIVIVPPVSDALGGSESGIGTDIPVPPDAQVEKETLGAVQFRLKGDQRDALLQFYRREMIERGWVLQAGGEGKDGAGLGFTRDNRLVYIWLPNSSDGDTLLEIVTEQRESDQ